MAIKIIEVDRLALRDLDRKLEGALEHQWTVYSLEAAALAKFQREKRGVDPISSLSSSRVNEELNDNIQIQEQVSIRVFGKDQVAIDTAKTKIMDALQSAKNQS